MCEPAPAMVARPRCSAAWPLAVAIAADAALERRDAFLQHRIGRVGDARIHVAGAFHVEQRRGVIGIAEDEGGGEVDRRRARAGVRVGRLSGVQAERVEA